jgi:hypothetical protein
MVRVLHSRDGIGITPVASWRELAGAKSSIECGLIIANLLNLECPLSYRFIINIAHNAEGDRWKSVKPHAWPTQTVPQSTLRLIATKHATCLQAAASLGPTLLIAKRTKMIGGQLRSTLALTRATTAVGVRSSQQPQQIKCEQQCQPFQ